MGYNGTMIITTEHIYIDQDALMSEPRITYVDPNENMIETRSDICV